MGYDATTTYPLDDGLGINALPDSEKYKKGIRENTTGRARTLGIWILVSRLWPSEQTARVYPSLSPERTK